MNNFIHIAFAILFLASVLDRLEYRLSWMGYTMEELGITFDFSGIKKRVTIAPFLPDDLSFVKEKAHTICGTVLSAWRIRPDNKQPIKK